MKLIDKDAVVAEIKRLIRKNELYLDDNVSDTVRFQKTSAYGVLNEVLYFIDALEVKEVDLDNFIKEEFDKYSCVDGYGQLSVSYNMAEFYSMMKRLINAQKGVLL